MTIGDILAVIAAVLLAAASWGSTLIMVGLLFPAATARAEAKLTQSFGACLGRGVAVTLGVLLISAMFHAAGPLRLITAGLWCVLVFGAALGSAAVVKTMSERIGWLGTEMAPFARLTRAAALYVGAGFVPVAGWFLLTPVAALATVGAGVAALRRPKPVASIPAPPVDLTHPVDAA